MHHIRPKYYQIITCVMGICLFCFIRCEQVIEPPLADKKVRLLAPANNLATTDSIHIFYWEPLEGAVKYQLQIVSPRFDSIVRLETDTIINRNQFSRQLRPDTYQWRVRAIGITYTSAYSDTFNLKIQ